MRCPSCQKFVSYEGEEEPEVMGENLAYADDEATVMVEVRLVKNCAECSQELAEMSFSFEEIIDIPEEHQGDGHMPELQVETPEQIDRMQTIDRHGKPIKRARYMTHLYGVRLDYLVSCSCGERISEGEFSGEVTASGLEPLV